MSDNDKDSEKTDKEISATSNSLTPGGALPAESERVSVAGSMAEPDEVEQQFRLTCQKIREIEERARHSLRQPDIEHHCSFCNRPSSAAGSLCQPDRVDVYICLQCAETALELLRTKGD